MAQKAWVPKSNKHKEEYYRKILGMHDLKIENFKIYGDYQVEKKTEMSHKQVQHLTATYVVRLLHMDLMGPMQLESL